MRKYETPEMEVIEFKGTDVITTSSGDTGGSEFDLGLEGPSI